MKKNNVKKDKLPFRQRMFNKMLEKPINDILYVTYQEYYSCCRHFMLEENILSFDDYCFSINNKLKELYNGGVESC